jgi:hypothetical protein
VQPADWGGARPIGLLLIWADAGPSAGCADPHTLQSDDLCAARCAPGDIHTVRAGARHDGRPGDARGCPIAGTPWS